MVVCGIGGSYLGSNAAIDALNGLFPTNKMQIVYLGNTLDPNYVYQTVEYLKKVVAWCQLNERLHRWANLNFPAAKREYSDTLSGLFMAIFCN